MSFDIWHLGVPVKDLKSSVAFYVDVLGFENLGAFGKELAFVRPPGKAFTLELMEVERKEGTGWELLPHHLAFECDDLDAFRDALVRGGKAGEVPAIQSSHHGMRLFTVKDPDGTRVQFYHGRAAFDRAIRPAA